MSARRMRSSSRWLAGLTLLVVLAGCGSNSKNPVAASGGLAWRTQQLGFDGSAVWGSSSSDVYAVGSAGNILHHDGNAWTLQTSPTKKYLYGVWGNSRTDVFAVGNAGTILHSNGSSWTPQVSPTTNWLGGVWGTSSSNVYAVGAEGTILHFDGNGWTPQVSGTTTDLYGVWGSSPTDLYAIGHDGTLLHSSGGAISTTILPGRPVPSPAVSTPPDLFGIVGFTTTVGSVTTTDVFVVGEDGIIYRNNGSGWNIQVVVNPATGLAERHYFYAVWGSSSADVFAVGEGGMIYHFDGSVWKRQPSGAGTYLYGVWGSSATNLFAVGSSGLILHYSP